MSHLRETYGLQGIGAVKNARNLLVRMGRLELPRPCERWNLNPVRLPIPPHPRVARKISLSVTLPWPEFSHQTWSRGNSEILVDCG
jgi:hypothetical protein